MPTPYENMLKEHKAEVARIQREIEKNGEMWAKVPLLRAAIERTAASLRRNSEYKDGDL